MEALVFDAVKRGTCTRECLEGVSLPTCLAAGPVVSPDLAPVEAPALGPAFSLFGTPAPASITSKSIAYSQAQVPITPHMGQPGTPVACTQCNSTVDQYKAVFNYQQQKDIRQSSCFCL